MPRPSNTAERRAQIVDGLMRILPERGYERASINAIARSAGLTPGLVHYHFASKLEILEALVERLSDQLQRRIAARTPAGSDPRAQLHAFVEARLALGEGSDEGALACWVAVGAEALRQPEVRALYTRIQRDQRAALSAPLSALGAPDPEAAAAAALGTIEGLGLLGLAAPGCVPPGSAAAAALAMIEGALPRLDEAQP